MKERITKEGFRRKRGRIRLGLCCIFRKEPIRFRSTTAKHLLQFSRSEQLRKLSAVCLHNSKALLASLEFLKKNGIGAFRILSPFLPRYTHPDVGYTIDDLPDFQIILNNLKQAREFSQKHDIRLSFHPDQFILLSSPQKKVVENSIKELKYQAMLAEYLGADVINIHGGGAYGDKQTALAHFTENFQKLPAELQQRLTLENDDRSYTVGDLIPVCRDLNLPLVYDVHHHRCNPGKLTVEEATELSLSTWTVAGREPYFHISSPLRGWHGSDPKPHADFIDPDDFPECWKCLEITVDVEAKAKELAVLELLRELDK
ncbi:MAG: UV DNA damage repair endonuclease UvsE [Deltaproteobacteria bacterium]|jgi:UV DNA damage endonuclease|nr:UV DNA damage repair endonuclease UvsE [Deltaproteobacteria bacterium]